MDSKLKMGSGGEDGEREKNNGKSKRKMDEEEKSTKKKSRLVWTAQLHQQFVNAYNELLDEYPTPSAEKIHRRMNNPELSVAQISRHLSTYLTNLAQSQQQSGNSSRDVAFGQNLQAAALVPFSLSGQQNLQATDWRFNNYGFENPNSRLSFGNMNGMPSGVVSRNIQNMNFGSVSRNIQNIQSGIPNTFHLPANNPPPFLVDYINDTIELAAVDNNRIIIPLSAFLSLVLQEYFNQQQIHQEVSPVIGINNNNINITQSVERPFRFDAPPNYLELAPAVSVPENLPPNISQLNSSSRPFEPLGTSNNTERGSMPITLDLISALDQQPQEEGMEPVRNEDLISALDKNAEEGRGPDGNGNEDGSGNRS